MKIEDSFAGVEFSSPEAQTKSAKPKGRFSGLIVAAAVGLAVGAWIGLSLGLSKPDGLLDYSGLDEIYSELQKNYDGEIDVDGLLSGAKRGMVEGLGDPYSQFFSNQEADEFIDDLEGEFEGVGIEILNKDGKLTIMDVLNGTPAEQAGLLAGDLVAKVDERETLDWLAEEAVKVIRGPAGSVVKLTIIRDNEIREFDITRAAITAVSVEYEIKDGIGIISITRFGETDTVSLSKKAAQEFVNKNVKGVVLDLRGNGGGYVTAAVDVASLWVAKNQVVTTEKVGNVAKRQDVASGGNILNGIKTVVLIDGGSASASEILAGALQDYGLATVVGGQSFGKGSVQTLKTLSSGDQLKLTVAKWYTPDDRNIDKTGIEPDEVVKFDSELYKTSGVDSQLEKALELLRTP